MAIAPALTIGFIVRSAFNSIAITELNGRPVPLTPSFLLSLLVTDGIAHEREHKGLGHALDRDPIAGVAGGGHTAIGAHDAGAEEVRCYPGECRDVIGDDAVVDGAVALVRLDEQLADYFLSRQPSGRDVPLGESMIRVRLIAVQAPLEVVAPWRISLDGSGASGHRRRSTIRAQFTLPSIGVGGRVCDDDGFDVV